jgi:hypothetical protein
MPSQAQWSKLNEFLAQVGAYDEAMPLAVNTLNQLRKLVVFDQGRVYFMDTDGKEIARLNILTDASGVVYLQSDLLDDSGLYYAFDSGFDWSTLLLANENGWPSLLHVLSEIQGASKTWQEKAQPYAEQFSLNIQRWMDNYLKTSSEQNASGAYVTTVTYEIPMADLLQETKQMLLARMIELNPALQKLIDALELEIVEDDS